MGQNFVETRIWTCYAKYREEINSCILGWHEIKITHPETYVNEQHIGSLEHKRKNLEWENTTSTDWP